MYQVPGLQFVVVNPIALPEDEEVVLLIALAGFVLHVPVVLPSNLVVVPDEDERNKVSSPTSFLRGIKGSDRSSIPKTYPDPRTRHLVHSPSPPPGPAFASSVSLPQAGNRPQTGSLPHPSCLWMGGVKSKHKGAVRNRPRWAVGPLT